MKKIGTVLFLALSITSNAQVFKKKSSSPDTLNIAEVNKTLKEDGIFNTVNIYNTTHYPPYNEKRYKLSEFLISEIDFLNGYLKNSHYFEIKNSVETIKNKFSNIDLTIYETAYKLFFEKKVAKEITDAYNDSVSKENMNKAGILDKLNKQEEEDRNYRMRLRDDSIWQAKKDKQNAIEAENVRLQNFAFLNECIKKFGKVKGEKISQGQIALGDTKLMVEFAWGSADKISNSISNNDNIEIWYYKKYNAYLSFKKGVLINYVK